MRFVVFFLLLSGSATGRAQWDIQDSHTQASLRGVHSLGDGVAWASGTDGTVLRTEDAGVTWKVCSVAEGAEKLDFRGVQAFDSKTAIVMSSGKGDLSRLYRTTDGCRTWKIVLTNPDAGGFWDAIVFDVVKPMYKNADWQSNTRGFLVGDPVDGKFVIFQSRDSGQNWDRWANNKEEQPAKAAENESLFAASNSAANATGTFENLAFVTGGDGGAHLFVLDLHDPFDSARWLSFTKSKLPFVSTGSAGAFSIASRKLEEQNVDFMVVGGSYLHPDASGTAVFLPTRNYCCFGLIPQKVVKGLQAPHGYRSAVAYDPTSKTWITVGPNGTDISADDGRNWLALRPGVDDAPDADKNWNALSLPFVVGPHGRIGVLRKGALVAPTLGK